MDRNIEDIKPESIFKDKGVLITVLICIAAAVFAASSLIYSLTKRTAGSNIRVQFAPNITASQGTPQTAQEAFKAAEGTMSGIYATVVVPGTKAVIAEDAVMHFDEDRTTFSGFFDKDTPSIEGTYTVTAPPDGAEKNVKAIVTVQAGDGRYVSYNLELDGDSAFALVYPGSDIKVRLEEDRI